MPLGQRQKFRSPWTRLKPDIAFLRRETPPGKQELLEGVAKVLAIDGTAAFIIPYKEEKTFLEIAKMTNLFPSRISRYRGNIKSELKRSLIQLINQPATLIEEEFFLEHSRHEYSDHYKNLVKDFYIKL